MSLTPREYAIASPAMSRGIDLPEIEHYLLFCDDSFGQRWTVIGTDKVYFEMLRDASDDLRSALSIPTELFPIKRAGWPDEW